MRFASALPREPSTLSSCTLSATTRRQQTVITLLTVGTTISHVNRMRDDLKAVRASAVMLQETLQASGPQAARASDGGMTNTTTIMGSATPGTSLRIP